MGIKIVRVGLVGAGRVAQHYKKILDSGDVSGFAIVGVCDIKAEVAAELAAHWNCRSYIDYFAMLREARPDLVLVLTPSGRHHQHVRIALENGCNVLVEKPAAMLPAEAREMSRLAKEKQLMLGVAFQNRFNPAIQCLRRAVQSKRFGKIITATIRLRWCRNQDYYEDGWHGTWAQDGGVINQQAIHHVDALNWLMGPVNSVCAAIANRLNQLEAEDTMIASLKFADGSLGTIEATTAARPQDFEASLSVVGEKGLVVVGGIALNKIETWKFVEAIDGDDEVAARYSEEVPNGYGLSHGRLLQETIDRLITGDIDAPVPVEGCIATTELIHALYSSHETGGWASLANKPLSNKLGVK
jgi:UDP-N-acetyl-2-amino-2-deoxyglucuronate dehydrogenase